MLLCDVLPGRKCVIQTNQWYLQSTPTGCDSAYGILERISTRCCFASSRAMVQWICMPCGSMYLRFRASSDWPTERETQSGGRGKVFAHDPYMYMYNSPNQSNSNYMYTYSLSTTTTQYTSCTTKLYPGESVYKSGQVEIRQLDYRSLVWRYLLEGCQTTAKAFKSVQKVESSSWCNDDHWSGDTCPRMRRGEQLRSSKGIDLHSMTGDNTALSPTSKRQLIWTPTQDHQRLTIYCIKFITALGLVSVLAT